MSLRPLLHLILLMALLCPSFSGAQKNKQEQLELQRQQKLKEIKKINALLFSNKKEEKSIITRIEDLNYKLSVRQNLINITNEQANLLTRKINNNQNEITQLRAQLKELKDDYAAMIVKSYKNRSTQSRIMFLLSSDNFKQAYKRLQYLNQYTEYQREQGEVIKEKTATLQDLNIKLNQQKANKQKLIEENRAAKRELEKEIAQREVLMASIRDDMSKFASQLKKKQQEVKRLDRDINRLIKAAIAASNKKAGNKSSTGKFVLTPEAKRLASNFKANKGKLGWPVSRGVIKIKFGRQRSLTDRSVTQNYKSIYIATEKNAEVKAVFNGEVSGILIVKNGNPAVIVKHGNYLTVYMNLAQILVKKGDQVTTGQTIGKVFSNPNTGESLLGFRVYNNDKVTNPEYWLTKN